MKDFLLKVSTSQGKIYERNVNKLFLRGVEGDLSILADHIPFITVVTKGTVEITDEYGKEAYVCRRGILMVYKGEALLLTSSFKSLE